MDLKKLRSEINRDMDDSFNNGDIDAWINRAIDDITPVAKKEKLVTISGGSLPTDLHDIAIVIVNNTPLINLEVDDFESVGYKVWDNAITLQNIDGPITLYYYKKLNHLSFETDAPEFEEEFHDLIIYYVRSHIQFYDEDERADSRILYNQRKTEYENYKKSSKRKGKIRERVIW